MLLAREEHPPKGVEPIAWILLTSLPIDDLAEASEILQWYLCRWQIEVFFRVLKSGCKIENLQLQLTDRLELAISLYLIVAWRVLFLTRLGRTCPDLSCEVVFTPEEWHAVYIVAKRKKPPKEPPRLNEMIRMVASFGGFLGRKDDGEPGPKALWTGLQRIRDFVLMRETLRALPKLCVTMCSLTPPAESACAGRWRCDGAQRHARRSVGAPIPAIERPMVVEPSRAPTGA